MKTNKKTWILVIATVFVVTAVLLAACNGTVTLYFVGNGGVAPAPMTAQQGETVTLPELENKTENGKVYVFDGWSANSDLSGNVLRGDIAAPNEDTTYYARWAQAYVLTLDPGEGTLTQTFVYLKAGDSIADAVKDIVPTVDDGIHFDGWTLDGALIDGTTVMPESDATLVAKYTRTMAYYTDALGGEDSLYIRQEEPDAIYLVRESLGERKGEYNATTNVFTFKEKNTVVLSGKLTGEYFYYFNSDLMREYAQRGGNAKLIIREQYAATYTDANGKSTEGVVEFDTYWHNYVFRGGNVEENFVLETDETGTALFVLQNMQEAGAYRLADSEYPVLTLDGLGNLKYEFDPEHPTYYDITGEPVLEAEGTYTVNESGYYEASMYVGSTPLEDFLFRIVDFDGKVFERSDFYGDLDSVGHTLVLDGFGQGFYTDEQGVSHHGSYEIVSEWWMTFDGQNAMRTWLINFCYDGATEDIYYALTQSSNGTVSAELFGKVPTGTVGGLYTFTNAITLGGQSYSEAFIMLLLDQYDASMVLVSIDKQSLSSGEEVSVFAPMYSGLVTAVAGSDGLYHYADTYQDAQMNFRLGDDGTAEFVTESGSGTLEKRQIAPNVTVDPNTGTATYTDENGQIHLDIQYGYSMGEFIEIYVLALSETESLYFYRDVHDSGETFTQIYAENILDYDYITEDLYNAFPARLLLVPGSTKAYIAVPTGIGEPTYVGDGTYSKVSDTEYRFTNRNWASNLLDFFGGDGFTSSLDQFKKYYSDFTFRVERDTEDNSWKFFERYDDMLFLLDNFVADGYSTSATYTLDDSTVLHGTFRRMEIIIVFECEDGTTYYLKEDGRRMKNVSEDAGLYYLYNPDDTFFETFGPNSGSSYSDYIVFDGENGVTIVNFEDGFLANTKHGRMEKTENWTENLREYTVTEDETGNVYRILLGTFESIWHEVFLVYDLYNDAYTGFWYTEDYGELRGDGYRLHSATYDVDGDGTVVYTGTMVRARFDKTDIQTHAYTVDENGDVIVFNYKVDDERSASFVFDIVKGDSGMEYLVERKLIFGSFAFWQAGERNGEYIYLDGKGVAERYDANGRLLGTGSYRLAPEIDEVSYCYENNSDGSKFYFAIYIEQESSGVTYFEYRLYNGEVNGEYDCDDWSHLSVGFYGEITYTDRYGVVYEGYYSVQGNQITLITHDESGLRFTFYFDQKSGEFQLVTYGEQL